MNDLYNQLNSGNNNANIIKQFQQFKKTFTGDAKEQVQQLLNSGAVSQEEYNRAVQMANNLKQIL